MLTISELKSIFILLSKIENGLEPLANQLCDHIKRIGLAKMEEVAKSDNIPNHFVPAISNLYIAYQELINVTFNHNPIFGGALSKALSAIVNEKENVLNKEGAECSIYLPKYLNNLLTKSSPLVKTISNGEDGVNTAITQAINLIGFYREKDVIFNLYQKFLSIRLLTGDSASQDREVYAISQLKTSSLSYHEVRKFEAMFKDIKTSEETCGEFKQHGIFTQAVEMGNIPKNCNVVVITQGMWPNGQVSTMTPPVELDRLTICFHHFYLNKHPGRRLNWNYSLTRAELNFTAWKKLLEVDCFQAGILLQFATKDQVMSLSTLRTAVGANDDFDKALRKITDKKVLVVSDDEIQVNSTIPAALVKGNKRKIVLWKGNGGGRAATKREVDDMKKQAEGDRGIFLQAAIVRAMKARKTLSYNDLFAEVSKAVGSRFPLIIKLFKDVIELLIEKEFLKRDEDDKNKYHYLA